jgi:hypothetical protein
MPLERQATSAEAPRETSRYRWYHKVSALVFIVFCFELGVFLLVFPWLEYWDQNFFSAMIPEWHSYWENGYVRGAVSGVGALNLYIAVLEIFRLRRFSST